MPSPTPWTVVSAPKEYLRRVGDGDFSILDANGDEIAEQTEFYPTMLGEEDTALVVRAVNSHADMLEALDSLVKKLDGSYSNVPVSEIRKAKAIVAKAKGGAR